MAIWYARDRMKLGDVFGNEDYHHGLGVLIDTYSNHNGPHAVSALFCFYLFKCTKKSQAEFYFYMF